MVILSGIDPLPRLATCPVEAREDARFHPYRRKEGGVGDHREASMAAEQGISRASSATS